VTATKASLARAYVGTSGWSYPSWRPDFYPAGVKPTEFLAHYAERFRSVELNTTGYRLPAEDQFRRWAEATPAGFRFAVKMNAYQLRASGTFVERIRQLGSRLGPVRVLVSSARDEGFLTLALGSLDPDLQLAFDFRHDSWEGVELSGNAVRVNDFEAEAGFRYLRFREPPYDKDQLAALAARIRPLLAVSVEVYGYFKHEDAPTAPNYAAELIELLS
jgi:uncharacterized protein YecE (DUF72 family)